MYRDGLGVRPDPKTALAHFTQAAGQDLAEAQVNLAKLHLGPFLALSLSSPQRMLTDSLCSYPFFPRAARNEIQLATNYLHQAARSGSPFEAYYHLGLLYAAHARAALAADLRPETCGVAVAHLKQAAERGAWDADFGGAEEADRSWERGETDKAVLGWWMAGERGVESAQNNLAFLLDQGASGCLFPLMPRPHADLWVRARTDTPAYTLPWRRVVAHNETAKIALNHWTRSAAQGDVDALVKVRPLVSPRPASRLRLLTPPHRRSALRRAARRLPLQGPDGRAAPDGEGGRLLPGRGREPGVGHGLLQPRLHVRARPRRTAGPSTCLPLVSSSPPCVELTTCFRPRAQDWHLAKRNYDLSLASNPDAALPVNLALVRLHARALWAALTGRSQRGLALFSSPPRRHDDPLRVGLIESVKQGLKGWSLTNDELEEERAGGGSGGGGGGERRAARRDEAGEPVYDAGDWIGTSADDEFFDDEDDEAWIEVRPLLSPLLSRPPRADLPRCSFAPPPPVATAHLPLPLCRRPLVVAQVGLIPRAPPPCPSADHFFAVSLHHLSRWTRQQAEERDRAARQAGAPAPQPAAAAGPQPPLQQAPAPVPPWPPFA